MDLTDLLFALNDRTQTVVVTRAEAVPNPVGDRRVTRELPRAATIPEGRYTITASRPRSSTRVGMVTIRIRHENIMGAIVVRGLLAGDAPLMDVDLRKADLRWLEAALPGFTVCDDLAATMVKYDVFPEELLAAYIRLYPGSLPTVIASLTGGAS